MAKLTLTFKGLPLKGVELSSEETSIGRDPNNDVHIDSLAVNEFHAVVSLTGEGYHIRAVSPDCIFSVNHKPAEDTLLRNGDEIQIGKHLLFFTDTEAPAPRKLEPRKSARARSSFEGTLQVLNGQRIGMVIPLKTTVTQIGKIATGLVVVTREEKGYTIATGSDNVTLTVNGRQIGRGEVCPLESGDMIRINNALLQFFQR